MKWERLFILAIFGLAIGLFWLNQTHKRENGVVSIPDKVFAMKMDDDVRTALSVFGRHPREIPAAKTILRHMPEEASGMIILVLQVHDPAGGTDATRPPSRAVRGVQRSIATLLRWAADHPTLRLRSIAPENYVTEDQEKCDARVASGEPFDPNVLSANGFLQLVTDRKDVRVLACEDKKAVEDSQRYAKIEQQRPLSDAEKLEVFAAQKKRERKMLECITSHGGKIHWIILGGLHAPTMFETVDEWNDGHPGKRLALLEIQPHHYPQ